MKQSDKDTAREVLTLLLDAQKAGTVRSTFKRLAPGEDGRIRTVLSPGGTETGRLSSGTSFLDKSTNLQNLAKKVAKLDPLYIVRAIIVSDPGRILWAADYSAAERVLLAYIARERRVIKQIEAGINTYKWFAGHLFDMPDWESLPKDDPRYHASKTISLAADRGVGWKTLMTNTNKDTDLTGLSFTAKEAKRGINLFHSLYPGYRRYFAEVEDELRQTSELVNICGRKRIFFARRRSRSDWESLVKEGVSFQAQAIGDIINARLRQIHEKYDPDPLRLLLQIHDEILGDCAKDKFTYMKVARIVKKVMEQPIDIFGKEVVIPAEVSVGYNWAEMEQVL